MHELHASLATILDSDPADDAAATSPAMSPLEFVGYSDDTLAEAVRRALSHASTSLRTLDGVSVVVIPQIGCHEDGQRFQVTLRIS